VSTGKVPINVRGEGADGQDDFDVAEEDDDEDDNEYEDGEEEDDDNEDDDNGSKGMTASGRISG
jgi:hypothetical protein